jgi:hypothetical protein
MAHFPDAQSDTVTRLCRSCWQPFQITASERAYHAQIAERRGWDRPALPWHCADCRAERRREKHAATPGPDVTLSCSTCGATFTWTSAERSEYAEKNWYHPRRCETCRILRAPT